MLFTMSVDFPRHEYGVLLQILILSNKIYLHKGIYIHLAVSVYWCECVFMCMSLCVHVYVHVSVCADVNPYKVCIFEMLFPVQFQENGGDGGPGVRNPEGGMVNGTLRPPGPRYILLMQDLYV